jgi:hypothetical protein
LSLPGSPRVKLLHPRGGPHRIAVTHEFPLLAAITSSRLHQEADGYSRRVRRVAGHESELNKASGCRQSGHDGLVVRVRVRRWQRTLPK